MTTPATARPFGTLAERVLVVVPTLNEADGIERCLDTLMTEGTEGALFLVSDGGSTDATRALVAARAAERPNLALRENPARVQAAAVNQAARAAPAARDLLVRCDAHATYPAGYVLGVAAAMERTGAHGLVVAMRTAPRPGAGAFERANALAVSTPLGTGGSAHRTAGSARSGWVDHGHHAGLRRDAFLAVGGYDEALPANEDAELDTRLARAGGGVWLEAGLHPTYHPRRTPRALWRQYARYGAGRAIHARRHGTGLRARQLGPALLAPGLLASLALGLAVPAAFLPALAYLAVLTAAATWLAVRARDPAGLLSGLALAIMHVAWSVGFWRGRLL